MNNLNNEVWVFNKVKYQHWFLGNKIEVGKPYMLVDLYSEGYRVNNINYFTKQVAEFVALDDDFKPIYGKIYRVDNDEWYTQVSFKDGEMVGRVNNEQ